MKRAIYQGGQAWEQINIPTIPPPDLPLLPDITTIAPLCLAINIPKSMQSVNNFFSEVFLRAACNLFMVNAGLFTFDMPRAFIGFTGGLHDWNLAFVPQG